MNNYTPDELKDKIRQAEESVAGMQDEGLKRVAFETVLSSLLGQTNTQSGTGSSKTSQNKGLKKKKKTATTKDSTRQKTVDKASSLKLTVDQLKELKTFYDHKAPAGTEEVVFTLAAFVHENLKQEEFHPVDLHLLYQNLIPLKPTTKPPSMGIDEIKRAVRWLVAPSRKKKWLEDIGDGMYKISSQGLLRMTYDGAEEKTN